MDKSFDYVSIKPADNGYIVRVDIDDDEEFEGYAGKVLLFLDWEQVTDFVKNKFNLDYLRLEK